MSRELISEFVAHLQESGKSRSTVIAYQKDISQIFEHLEQDLLELTHLEINKALAELKAQYDFTAKTISRKINSIRTFYKYLVEKGHRNDNPGESVNHPKLENKVQRILHNTEYLALREISRGNDRLHAMIELMLQTGIRIGELSRLKLKHVNIDGEDNHLHIEPYSSVPARKVPLNPKAVSLINNYLESVPQEADVEHPLFFTRDGNHIIIRNIRSSIDRAMSKAGIKDACVNDLRNTFITKQLESGTPIDYLSQIVGHKNKVTTSKYLDLLEGAYKPNGELKVAEL